MNKKYAVFDMDGTLIDSMKLWANLGYEYLKQRGIAENDKNLTEKIAYMTMTESSKWMINRFGLTETAEKIISDMNYLMELHYKNDVSLKPGVKEYLKSLKTLGVKMCVVSATDKTLVKACLERLEILQYFDFVLSCETLGKSKREPGIYFDAAKRFGCAPKDAAVYEDALYAVKTAQAAGFYVIGVYDETSDCNWHEICRCSSETIIFK